MGDYIVNLMKNPLAYISTCLLVASTSAHAVILYGADNDTNLTDPGSGLPFDIVARVASGAGVEDGGSGVHLGGGFMLTAAHINNAELNSVTFDDSTFFTRDTSYTPQQIGNTDLKVFKLTSSPTVGAAQLYTGAAETSNGASLVGWGRGREEGSALNSNTVPIAGGGTSLVKRWGTNDPTRTVNNFSYTRGSDTFTFDAVETVLGNPLGGGTGDFEAAATPRDSGAGLFQLIDGTWYLTGIASLILSQDQGNVTYGNDTQWFGDDASSLSRVPGTGDPNYYVQISSYESDIAAIIPEPSSAILILTSSLLLFRRRRS